MGSAGPARLPMSTAPPAGLFLPRGYSALGHLWPVAMSSTQPLVLAPRPWSSACHTSGDCTVPRICSPESICYPRSLWSGLLLSPGLSQEPRGGPLDQETYLGLTSHLGPRGSHKGLSWASHVLQMGTV